jgi:murein DD-endopeptidase MepM/ murein hydrolase activator NlpD
MQKKVYTFLIFPGVQGKVRRIQFPSYFVHMLVACGMAGMVALAALANTYARMLLKVSNYNDLRSEREALLTQNRTLENAVSQTNAQLISLQLLAAEVALTYGFGQTRRPRFPGALLALATQSNASLGSSYHASLYAFNLIQRAAEGSPKTSLALGMFPTPMVDHSNVPSIWPVRGQISAGFGQRLDPFSGEGAFHAGVDISAPRGAEVEAVADGIILQAGREGGYGNEILIDHGNGMTTKYGHLSRIYVLMGQAVRRGQIIGAVGMTGRATGPHLHYEILVHETPVNPAKYLHG